MRQSTFIAIVVASVLVLCAALVGLGAVIVAFGTTSVTSDWQRPSSPTTFSLQQLRDRGSSPVYWYGPGTGFGPGADFDSRVPFGPDTASWPLTEVSRTPTSDDPSDSTGDGPALVFTYGLFCGELDPGSGLTCQDQGRVVNAARTSRSFRAPRPDCWKRVGQAWLIDCGSVFEDSDGRRLLSGSRVVRFTFPTATDRSFTRPWRELIGLLRRFDDPSAGDGVSGLAPARPATRAEYAALGTKSRAALPRELRP